jgi:hypothetical protein
MKTNHPKIGVVESRSSGSVRSKSARSSGDILVSVLVFAAIAITMIIGLVNWGAVLLRSIRNVAAREQAFQIAEAGVDYYQWHLAQSPNDYKDGTTTPQPYVHKFFDRDGNLLGTYSLTITPPPVGSTIVKIVSVGALASGTVSRTVQETLAIPSLARFAVVANDNMNFGAGTTVFGPIQSNGGIHFDGLANNLVSSAMSTYTDPDDGSTDYGVYTTASPSERNQTSLPAPSRPGIFTSGRQFPVPSFPFGGLAANLNQLQLLAENGGKEWTTSNSQGYHIVFETPNSQNGNATSYFMYKVTALQATPNNCGKDGTAQSQTQWGTWSIKGLTGSNNSGNSNETTVNGPNPDHSWPIPGNGVIFVDDDIWVDGTVSNARITIAAGIIGSSNPDNYSNITINTNLRYTNTNGNDVIGLIAQGNINSGMVSDDTYEIDAALVAENGRVGRYYYNGNCTVGSNDYSQRNSLTLLGMIATAIRYGFAYSDGTGYDIRNINYDANLLYAPPPSFPQATTQYQVISWQQLN